MVNYLYPALGGGGGGGGVASVTASLPLVSSGGANPNITINTVYNDVGAGYPYANIAAAIAAGPANAAIRIHANTTENVALPRGMSLTAPVQNGAPTITLTGSITSAFGVGRSSVSGLIIVGNGADITFANASTNILFTNCIFSQGADFKMLDGHAGANVVYNDCVFTGPGIATTVAFQGAGANIAMYHCSTLAIGSGLFADITSGGLTVSGDSIIVGRVTIGAFTTLNCNQTLFSVTSGPAITTVSTTPGILVNCQISSNDGAANALQGNGSLVESNLIFVNTQKGIDSTLNIAPYRVVAATIGGAQSLLAATTIAVSGTCKVRVAGNGGAVILTGTPTITGDFFDGDIVIIIGTDDTNTVTLQDKSNLAGSDLNLNNGLDFTLGINDNITLMYNLAKTEWQELSRNDLAT